MAPLLQIACQTDRGVFPVSVHHERLFIVSAGGAMHLINAPSGPAAMHFVRRDHLADAVIVSPLLSSGALDGIEAGRYESLAFLSPQPAESVPDPATFVTLPLGAWDVPQLRYGGVVFRSPALPRGLAQGLRAAWCASRCALSLR